MAESRARTAAAQSAPRDRRSASQSEHHLARSVRSSPTKVRPASASASPEKVRPTSPTTKNLTGQLRALDGTQVPRRSRTTDKKTEQKPKKKKKKKKRRKTEAAAEKGGSTLSEAAAVTAAASQTTMDEQSAREEEEEDEDEDEDEGLTDGEENGEEEDGPGCVIDDIRADDGVGLSGRPGNDAAALLGPAAIPGSPKHSSWSLSPGGMSSRERRRADSDAYAIDPCVVLADLLHCRCLQGGGRRPDLVHKSGVPHALPQHLLLGLTLDGLREWLESELRGVHGGVDGPDGHAAQQRANRAAAFDGRSVCERMRRSLFWSHHVGQANVYVSWPLSAPVSALLDGLEHFMQRPTERGAPRERSSTFFWVCTCSLRLHSPIPPAGCMPPGAERQPSAEHLSYLEDMGLLVELIEHTLVLFDSWDEPSAVGRTHCLREIALSVERGARVDVALGGAAAEQLTLALGGGGFEPLRTLLDRLGRIDLWATACHDDRDRQYVLAEAARSGYVRGDGAAWVQEWRAGRGKQAVNELLAKALRAALVRMGRGVVAREARQAQRAARSASSSPPRAVAPSAELAAKRVGALAKEVEVIGLRQRWGSGHQTTLSAINGLASLHKANGDLALAEPLYRECLAARRKRLGGSDAATLTSVNNLGTLLFELGRMDEAVQLLGECHASRTRELGALAPLTLASLHKLGLVCRARRDYGEAISCLQKAVDGRRSTLGAAHADTVRSMSALAGSLHDRAVYAPEASRKADLDAAMTLYKEALAICRATVGEADPLSLSVMNNLGNLLHARGLMAPKFVPGRGPNAKREADLREGAELLRKSLEQSRAVHGTGHLESLISASNLGSALRSLGAQTADEVASAEADELITGAIEGIADVWASEIERRPQMADALSHGIAEVLPQDEAPAEAANAGGPARMARNFNAPGAFMRGLLSEQKHASPILSA